MRAGAAGGRRYNTSASGKQDTTVNQKVKMYTTTWCPDCRRAKYFLKEHAIPFEEINIEDTPGAAEFVIEVNQGKRRVPTFDVDGRTFYCSPYDPQQMAQEFRVKTCSGK